MRFCNNKRVPKKETEGQKKSRGKISYAKEMTIETIDIHMHMVQGRKFE